MSTYEMNIEQKYLLNIKEGLKLHEYRLANQKRLAINIGDIIHFISNQNKNFTLDVTVTNKRIYKSWEEVCDKVEHCLQDFKDVYSTKKEIILACSKFYTPQDVIKYGIIVFDIKLN